MSFPSAVSKFKPIYRISRIPVNITLSCGSEKKGWLMFFKQEIWQEKDVIIAQECRTASWEQGDSSVP